MKKIHATISQDDSVLTFSFDNPTKANAIDFGVIEALVGVLDGVDGSVGAVVIRGTGGKVFASGFDISAIPEEFFIDDDPMNNELYERLFTAIRDCPVPVVALLNGDALGFGMEIACACDLRVAQRGSRYGMPPAKLGLVYNPRGLGRFVTVLGASLTKELFLTAIPMTAERAHATGFANFIEEAAAIDSFTGDLAKRIVALNRNALAGTKYSLDRIAFSLPRLTDDEIAKIKEFRARSYHEESFQAIKAAFVAKHRSGEAHEHG